MNLSLIDKRQFPKLISKLLHFKEKTYKIVGTLQSVLAGKREVECYTDRWPDLTTVIVKPGWPHLSEESSSLFTTDLEQFRHVFKQSYCQLFDWTKTQMFGGIASPLCDIILDTIGRENFEVKVNGPFHLLHAIPGLFEDNEKTNLPAGYTFGTMCFDDTDTVAASWEYAREDTLPFIKFTLENYSSVSLLNDNKQIVGWYIEQPYGAQGMLHVYDAYRGQGLGKHLVRQLRDVILGKSQPAYVYVSPTNEPSVKIHEKCGYKYADQCMWLIINPRKG